MTVLPIEGVKQFVRERLTDAEIGQRFGVTKDTVRNFRVKHGISRTATPAPALPIVPEPPPSISSQPFAVPIAFPAEMKHGRYAKRGIIIPDKHIPFDDPEAEAILQALIKAFDPHYLVCIGDLLDAGKLSLKFPTDPRRLDTLDQDIKAARVVLHQWAQLAPNAQRWLLEGNHEQRLTRLMWGSEGPYRELMKLEDVQATLSWPHLLRLDEIGWKWVAYDDQPRADILPRLLVKHGNFVSSEAGMTAKREWQKYGHSGVSGHTHRAAVWRHRDYNGQATWIEAGCICRYDTPGAASPNWQQAVTLIEWSEDESLMNVEQVLIRDGRAMWRGEELRG